MLIGAAIKVASAIALLSVVAGSIAVGGFNTKIEKTIPRLMPVAQKLRVVRLERLGCPKQAEVQVAYQTNTVARDCKVVKRAVVLDDPEELVLGGYRDKILVVSPIRTSDGKILYSLREQTIKPESED